MHQTLPHANGTAGRDTLTAAEQDDDRRHVALPYGLTPLLVRADVAGPLCGRSEQSWWRDHAAGRVPAPVKIMGSTLWRVDELRSWVEASCPDRRTWEAMRAAKK